MGGIPRYQDAEWKWATATLATWEEDDKQFSCCVRVTQADGPMSHSLLTELELLNFQKAAVFHATKNGDCEITTSAGAKVRLSKRKRLTKHRKISARKTFDTVTGVYTGEDLTDAQVWEAMKRQRLLPAADN